MRRSVSSVVTTVVVMALACSNAQAGGTPTQQCQSSKHGAAGKYVTAVLGCASKAAKAGAAIDAECVSGAAADVLTAFDDADARAGAACNGNGAISRSSLEDMDDAVIVALPAAVASDCAAAERKAAGKFAATLLKAYAKHITATDDAKLADALGKARTKLASSFDKAETKGGCAAGLDAVVQPIIEDAVEGLTACLASATACGQVESDAMAGGTVKSDPADAGATPADPVTTTIVTPVAGTVRIVEAESEQPAPAGFDVLGFQVDITAPPSTAALPLSFTFRIDASLLPMNPATVKLTRNGVIVVPCTGAPGIADPDPCESARAILGDGDLAITALSSHASVWAGVEPAPGATTTTTTTSTTLPDACTLTGTWEVDVDPTLRWNLFENPDGTVSYLGNFSFFGSGLVSPGASITRSGSVLTIDGSTGVIDATCDSVYFADYQGSPVTQTRLAAGACGDGNVDAGEQCDDGNLVNGDGCNLFVCDGTIHSEQSITECRFCGTGAIGCGNHVVEAGEECDDGNLQNNDNCLPTCRLPCGNGIQDSNRLAPLGGEMCDDGNRLNGDGCSSTCTYELVCGDGFRVPMFEMCDDGNVINGDGCSSTCRIE